MSIGEATLLIFITDALPSDMLADVQDRVARMRFVDGVHTASGGARSVKNNEQARESAALRELRALVGQHLRANPVFDLAVRPKALTPLVFARYGTGMTYGTHIDAPLMQGLRTDVSFTLFLADPDSYDGGELVIESAAGEQPVKLPAGSLVVYPATTLHRVEPVTRGERAVAVGWAQSLLRDAARRELLFDLDNARQSLFAREGKTAEGDLLAKTSANLLRMWAEP
jgi:PKHD-type hydroxylase